MTLHQAAIFERIRIHGGRVIDPANNIDEQQDLYIADGTIQATGNTPDGFTADRSIDASGCIVCPGLIDLYANLREPGQEHKATIASESHAAASGGITTLCCPPDTQPVIDTPAVVELIRLRAESAGLCRVLTIGALTRGLQGEQLSEMSALLNAGCVGVSNARNPVSNTMVERRALEYAATFGITVFLFPNDHWLSGSGCAHEGAVATRLGLPGIPETAETVAVARDLALIEQTGIQAHFCRLTTNRAVRMVARAQFDGLPVTADCSLPHLYLTEIDLSDFDSNCHVLPPLRTVEDRLGLRNGLANRTISVICSDHQPHEEDAKARPFPETEPGISGLETLLPLSLRLADEGILTLSEAIQRLTAGPATVMGLPYGTLSRGASADICIFDPDAVWQLVPETMLSRGRNTPFMGWQLKGRVTNTLLQGRLVFSRNAG